MKKYLQRAKEAFGNINKGLESIALADFEMRAEGFKKAIEDGWFKHFLIGAGITGAGLVYTGLASDNDFVSGMGYGAIIMAGLYSLPSYVLPALRNLRNKNTKEPSN